MRYLPFFLILLAPASAADAGSLLAEPPPGSVKLNEVVRFSAKAGYHFNVEAPQKCGAGAALEVSSGTVKCQFSMAGVQAVSLKLCAEKQTMCLFEEFTVKVRGRRGAVNAAAQVTESQAPPLPGFLQNDMPAALRRARAEGRLVFADIFTKWCPYCRLMEDTVLTHPDFISASSGMVRVSIDGDAPQAREWLTRFRPSGFPTYIVMDAGMREIGRMSGNAGPEAFSAWLREQERWKGLPIADAKERASSLDEAGRLRVAKVYMSEKEWAKARSLLSGIASLEAEHLDASCSLELAASSTDTSRLAGLYRDAIARFDGSDGRPAVPGVVDWITALNRLDAGAAKPWLEGAGTLAERLVSSKEAASGGYTAEDIYAALGDALDGAGMKERAAEMYSKAAAGYGARAENAGRAEAAKGLRMSQAGNLAAAGRYGDAAAVYGELAAAFPGEYPFHRSLASMLFRMKKYPEALREASLAAGLAYGDIRLDILYLKARIEAEMRDRTAALKTLDDAIASADLPGDAQLKTHRVYAKLKDYRKEVAAQK
ncbi:MAG TPA: thioredoxin family protein [Elusimicrobiales bacterium]|nr:thioredoxin family protein [Elusimicrobiales bacterium]